MDAPRKPPARFFFGFRGLEHVMSDIARRKTDHLDLATHGDVGFKQTTTLLECVRLMHDALPELAYDDIAVGVHVLGKSLRAPLVIGAMTGGTERAQRINRELAQIAEERGYGFGLGSQRAMYKNQAVAASYQVRDVAPTALLLGNVGVVQAAAMSSAELEQLVGDVGADALCIHLNPAMELVQAGGDRDFRGGLAAFARIARELSVPVVAKETGCGISGRVARRLHEAGVRHVDVSGAGGTSWVAVETQRATPERRGLGETFWEWGIPTAASLALVAPHGFETVIATGGIKSGLDVARAIALGADVCAIARPVLQALERGGRAETLTFFDQIESELRVAMLLVGAPDLAALKCAPRLIQGELAEWLEQTKVQ
jgi:isopentenyl-diphosphate delta-isomerase